MAPISQVWASDLPVDYWLDVAQADASKLSGLPYQDSIQKNGGVQIPGAALNETLAQIQSRGAKIAGVRPLSSAVEAYFLNAIGKSVSHGSLRP